MSDHRVETVVMVQKRKKREQIAQLLELLLGKHPRETVCIAWDNADTGMLKKSYEEQQED